MSSDDLFRIGLIKLNKQTLNEIYPYALLKLISEHLTFEDCELKASLLLGIVVNGCHIQHRYDDYDDLDYYEVTGLTNKIGENVKFYITSKGMVVETTWYGDSYEGS